MLRLCCAISVALATFSSARAEDFAVIALPDTQFYSQDYPAIYDAQTQWVVNNIAARNIKFVTHLGDIVNEAATLYQWENARAAMARLDLADVPYGTCVGNHDINYPGDYYDPLGINYLSNFRPELYTGRPWYRGASPSGLSNYQIVTADGREMLFLHLLVETPAAELAWAQCVLNMHRDKPTLVSTHRYLFDWRILGQGRYQDWNYVFEPPYRHDGIRAEDFFNNFIRPNRQIYMVICGHNDGQYRQISTNQAGLPVHEILVDYQDSWPNGGDGFLRIMTFRPGVDLIDVVSYSPTRNSFDPGGDDTFTLSVDLDAYRSGNPVLRFQDGTAGYAGTQDTWIGERYPGNAHGGEATLWVDDDTENSFFNDYAGQSLLRFDNLFQGVVREGDPPPTRIPAGATIHRADLTINLFDDTDLWNPATYVHRMTRAWNESSTWNSLSGGIVPGQDCEAAVLATFPGDNDPDTDYHRTFSILPAVLAWAGGQPNYGLAFLPQRSSGFDDGLEIRSSEDGNITLRPALDVEFSYVVQNVAPAVTTPLTAAAPTLSEGMELRLTLAAIDPNPLDPLVFRINGVDVGYATGGGTIEHWTMMEDEGQYAFAADVLDDEATVPAGSVLVTVTNRNPVIESLTPDLQVDAHEAFEFAVVAFDPGPLDLIAYAWDMDGDGEFDDATGAGGQWSYATPGVRNVTVRVYDEDGGEAFDSFEVVVTSAGCGAARGDANCDNAVDFFDIDPFLSALFDPVVYAATYCGGDTCAADVDCNGATDFFDIDPFLNCLFDFCPQCP